MTKWFNEQLGFYPEEFMRLNPQMWIQRRNIKTLRDDEGNITGYTCESRKLTNDDYSEVRTQIEDTKRIIEDLTETAQYKEGYEAAMILLGQQEVNEYGIS